MQLNEEFEESTPDGRQVATLLNIIVSDCHISHCLCSYFHHQVKSLVTFEDGKIVCVQKAIKESQKSTKVIMIVTMFVTFLTMRITTSGEAEQHQDKHNTKYSILIQI